MWTASGPKIGDDKQANQVTSREARASMPLTSGGGEGRGPRGRRYRLLASVLSGLLLALAFPPWRLWPLVFVAWVPLWLSIDGDLRDGGQRAGWRQIFLRGWLMGFVAFPAMLHWLLALSNEEVTIPGLMIPSLLLIGLYLGIFFGAALLFATLLARWSRLDGVLLLPLVTALVEWLRSLGPLGFPWGTAAFALAPVPPLLQTTPFWGFWGLVFVVLLVNGLVVAGLRSKGPLLAAAALLVAGLWIYGEGVLARHRPGELEPGQETIRTLVVQPDIRRRIKWKRHRREEVIRTVLAHGEDAARQAADGGGFDLFIWPETVFPLRLLSDRGVLPRVEAMVDSLETPFLVGTQEAYWVLSNEERTWVAHNSALILYPGGRQSPVQRKMRLVPFSERMPLQKIAPWLGKIDFGQSNFYPGEGPVILEAGGARIGCLICFESAFPDLARDFVRAGADLLVLLTNDFWFGRSAGPAQHADMSVLRAVENRVSLVRCANTGISFVVDPWGRVFHETSLFARESFVATVPLGSGSFAARHPDWEIRWLTVALLLAVLWGGVRKLGFRKRPGKDPANEE